MNFSVTALELDGLKLIDAKLFSDERGFFRETWSLSGFKGLGIAAGFVQDNESLSLKLGTLRGLHYQRQPFQQAKLVRVLKGEILDVVVDIRKASATRGQWTAIPLRADSSFLYVPKGFAHGFVTLKPDTVVSYKVDAPYAPQCDTGILWKDENLRINWPFVEGELTISKKDQALPRMSDQEFQ